MKQERGKRRSGREGGNRKEKKIRFKENGGNRKGEKEGLVEME